MLGIVYFYAGLAKLNSDWLILAQPLKIWLPSKYYIPFLGPLMEFKWMPWAMSWSGVVFDLTVPFLLFNRSTRPYAFIAVIAFHSFTSLLFPIGMFPFIMTISVLIFFKSELHKTILSYVLWVFKLNLASFDSGQVWECKGILRSQVRLSILFTFFALQISLPFRYLMYPGELFWTEEGFRFSWSVMLIEKAG